MKMVTPSVLCCVMAVIGVTACSILLDGSPTSYAQYRKWFLSRNATLQLEFQTDEPNGLLLYTDDGGSLDFFELKLVEGSVRLRYNLGGGASILTVGKNLSDSRWHKVTIVRNDDVTKLLVDHISIQESIRGAETNFGNYVSNSYVYVGGVPGWYANKLHLLALPSVYYEMRFGGHIRNVIFADREGVNRRQEVVESRGVRTTERDMCDYDDPCLNGGICISTDSGGAACDCRFVDFEGELCEKVAKRDRRTYESADGGVKGHVPRLSERTPNDVQRTNVITNYETEELVFSGSGCGVEDDEDCKSVFTPGDDDLITPVYIPPTPKPRKTTPTTTTTKTTPTTTTTSPPTSTTATTAVATATSPTTTKFIKPLRSSPRTSTTLTPTTMTSTTTIASTKGSAAVDGTDNQFHFHFPDDHVTSTEQPDSATTRYFHQIPYPPAGGHQYNNIGHSVHTGGGSVNGDGIALVIGVIAGVLSVVISIILLVFKFCVQSEISYKADESKSYPSMQASAAHERDAPAAGFIKGFPIYQGVNCRNAYAGFPNGHQPNGSVDNYVEKKMSKKKDVKEWYV